MGKIRPATLLLCLLILVVAVPVARGQWAPNGVLVSDGSYYHREPQVVTDGRGGAILFWDQGLYPELYVQRLDVQGNLQWGAGHVLIRASANGLQRGLCLASDGANGALLAWNDDRNVDPGVYIQMVDSGGTVQWVADGIDSNMDGMPSIIPDGVGGAFLGGEHSGNAVVQRFDAAGIVQWTAPYEVLRDGEHVSLATDGAGGIMVGFDYPWSVRNLVHGERVDGTGNPLWGYTTVSDVDNECNMNGDVVPDGAGGAYWVWERDDLWGATETDVYAQRVDADGNKQWYDDGVLVGTRDSFMSPGARTVSDGFGGLLVVYSSSSYDVDLARVAPDGTVLWNLPASTHFALKSNGRVAPDGYGGAFVVWVDQRGGSGTGLDIYAQHIDKDGNRLWAADGAAICNHDRDQFEPEIGATGSHGAVVAWVDNRAGDLPEYLYAQYIHADGSIGDPPLEISHTTPDINDVDVALGSSVMVTFNQPVSLPSVLGGNFAAHGSQTGWHGGRITMLGNRVSLNPDDDFVPGEVVSVILQGGIQSTTGKNLTPVVWSFTAEGDGVHGGFTASREFSVDEYPIAVCPADINNDGDMDLLVANYNSDSLSFALGHGNGLFSRPTVFSTGLRPRGVVAGDFDNDGFLDAATVNLDDGDILLFIGDGHGGLAKGGSFDTGSNPGSICTADFDGDGYLDLATASLGYDAVSILFNDGAGGFDPPDHFGTGENPTFITAADLNGDGNVDLVTANTVSDDVSVLLNDGSGMFGSRTDLAAGDNTTTVHAADMDNDGDLDLVAAAYYDALMVLLLNNGDATFTTRTTHVASSGPYGGPPCDVNGDGYLDLVYANRGTNNVGVRLNDGSGGFGGESTYAVGASPIAVAGADFNNNGSVDLVIANAGSGEFSMLLNDFALSGVEVPVTPVATRLDPAVPNPFNPSTRINYALHRDSHVRLAVYDLRGRQIAVLVDEHQPAQDHAATWDGRDTGGSRVASGVYFYKLEAGSFTETRKMVLVK